MRAHTAMHTQWPGHKPAATFLVMYSRTPWTHRVDDTSQNTLSTSHRPIPTDTHPQPHTHSQTRITHQLTRTLTMGRDPPEVHPCKYVDIHSAPHTTARNHTCPNHTLSRTPRIPPFPSARTHYHMPTALCTLPCVTHSYAHSHLTVSIAMCLHLYVHSLKQPHPQGRTPLSHTHQPTCRLSHTVPSQRWKPGRPLAIAHPTL